jgi:DNA-binding NarL/FixJ family response regulator
MSDALILSDDSNLIDKIKKTLLYNGVFAFKKGDNINELLDCIINDTPDYLLFDIENKRVSWPVLVKLLGSTGIAINIMIIDKSFNRYTKKECMLYGIKGYILKDDVEDVIMEAIFSIRKGVGYYQMKKT